MHITKHTSHQLIVKQYPKFCWTVTGFLGIAGLFNLLAPLFGSPAEDFLATATLMLGIAVVVLMFAELRIFEFDRDRAQLRIRRCWIARQQTIDYPLATLIAVRLSSKTVRVEGYGGTGSRIELVYLDGVMKPLTTAYSSDATQRQVAIAIAQLFNVEAQVPPTMGEVMQKAVGWLTGQVFGNSSKRR
ncbi:hypothetical protein [Sphaerothrix gracilis]|uniref:hypothetical protein n=1 Tax=Sphaerothrix gracilis TaxID=3151835 RepID=UPI0031FBB7CF